MTPPVTRPLLGIFWMVVTGMMFVAVTALVKHVGGSLPAAQSAFLRYLLGLVFFLPLLRTARGTRIDPAHWKMFAVRGAMHSVGVLLWFYAMTRITIAEVTAMNYMAPVYVTIGAALFLGERLAIRRIVAVAMAFLGAMVILRPGFRELTDGHIAMLIGPVFMGASYLVAKRLTADTTPSVIVAALSVIVTICLAPVAIAVWVPPTMVEVGWLFLVATFATAGHYTMTLAFASAPVTVTQPITFLQLLWAVLVGAAFFGEGLDPWVIAGGLVILGSVTFITWREYVTKRASLAREAAPHA